MSEENNSADVAYKLFLIVVGSIALFYVNHNYAFMYNPVLGTPAIVRLDDTSKEFEKLAILPYKEHIVKYDAAKTKTTQAMMAAQMCSLNPKDDDKFDECIYSALYSKNASNEEVDPVQAIGNEIMEYSGYEETPTISPEEQRGDIIE